MKRLLALLAGGLGLGALLHRRRRTTPAAPTVPPPGADDLRAKLAASRTDAEPLPAVDDVDDVDTRRAEVHDRARRALGELDG